MAGPPGHQLQAGGGSRHPDAQRQNCWCETDFHPFDVSAADATRPTRTSPTSLSGQPDTQRLAGATAELHPCVRRWSLLTACGRCPWAHLRVRYSWRTCAFAIKSQAGWHRDLRDQVWLLIVVTSQTDMFDRPSFDPSAPLFDPRGRTLRSIAQRKSDFRHQNVEFGKPEVCVSPQSKGFLPSTGLHHSPENCQSGFPT